MFVTAILLLCWAAISWFSAPLDGNFLGLFLFSVDAMYPFLAALIVLAADTALWARRSGSEFVRNLRAFFSNERPVAIGLIAILFLHVILQLPAIIMYHGAHDADSALYGLAGFEIADGTMRPMFNIGKHHMGSLVPHLLAGLHTIFGSHAIQVRILLVAFYVGFLLLMFLFVRRHFDNATALIAILLAAIAPKELYKYLKHPENAVTLFLGMASLLLISRILEKKSLRPQLYFFLGCILGLGLWANYQFAYFVIAAAIFLFIKDKFFFLKPAPWATVGGMLSGGVVILVDGYFYNWPFLQTVGTATSTGSNFFAEFVASVGKFFSHIPAFLGSTVSEPIGLLDGTDIMPPWFSLLISLLFATAVIYFVIIHRSRIAAFLIGKNTHSGSGIVLIFAITVFLVYTLSSYSHAFATTRYVMPFWIPATIMLAVSIRQLGDHFPGATSSFTALFASLFLFSSFFEVAIITTRESWHRTFVTELKNREINAIYGPWLRTYWTTFVTNRQIAATASYPTVWNPITHYHYLVDSSERKPAYLFVNAPAELAYRDTMLRRLDAVSITYRQLPTTMGILIFDFSQRVTPKQFLPLVENTYQASVTRAEAHFIGGTTELARLHIEIENTGKTPWLSSGRGGHVELLLQKSDGNEIRRIPVAQDVHPDQRYEITTLLEPDKFETNMQLFVIVNDFIINTGKSSTFIYAPVENVTAFDIQEETLNLNFVSRDGAFISGWGRTVQTERGTTRWSGAERSTIVFPLVKSDGLHLRLALWPFQADNMPEGTQHVGIAVNGEHLKNIEFEKFEHIEMRLPARTLQAGMNYITFSFSLIEPTYSPLRIEGDIENTNPRFRHRPRAVAFSEIILSK